MEMRYKHVEGAVASALGIKPGKMAAFKARLLYLRNMGLPKLPKVGSGQQVTYTERHALEILIAILLERGGQAPKVAAQFAKTIVATLPPFFGPDGELRLDEYVAWERTKEIYSGDIRIIITATDQPTSMKIVGDKVTLAQTEQWLTEELPFARKQLDVPPPYVIVNISAWVRKLKTELNRVIEAG